jgi:hypothetical protein
LSCGAHADLSPVTTQSAQLQRADGSDEIPTSDLPLAYHRTTSPLNEIETIVSIETSESGVVGKVSSPEQLTLFPFPDNGRRLTTNRSLSLTSNFPTYTVSKQFGPSSRRFTLVASILNVSPDYANRPIVVECTV